MSNQPPPGQGSWQQPPAGPPPGQGPSGPPGPPPQGPPPGGPPPGGPPPGGPPPGGPGGPPPGGPGGPPPPGGFGPGGPGGPPGGPGGPDQFGPDGPPGKSKLPWILGGTGAAIIVIGGLLLYFLVFSSDDEASGEDYCTLLKDNTGMFADLSSGSVTDPEQVEDFVNTLHDLREAAPEEVEDDWAKLDDPFQEIAQALDDAGISWEEANNMAPEDFPDEVRESAENLTSTLSKLDLSAISQTIEDHAQDECGIDPSEFQNSGQ